jgi:hypothetical protein
MKIISVLVLGFCVFVYALSYFLDTSYIQVVIAVLGILVFFGLISGGDDGDWFDDEKTEVVKDWHILAGLIFIIIGLVVTVSYYPYLETIGAK